MDIKQMVAEVKAQGSGSRKSSHPGVIHYLCEELRSRKGGTGGGHSIKGLALFLTARGYDIEWTQIHGMIHSETAKKSHNEKYDAFKKLIDAGNAEASEQVKAILTAEPKAVVVVDETEADETDEDESTSEVA
jgi:hypothetical protein